MWFRQAILFGLLMLKNINYLFVEAQISLITGALAQSPHFVTWTMQPSSSFLTSTILWHFEQVEEIVKPHFLQLYVSNSIAIYLIRNK